MQKSPAPPTAQTPAPAAPAVPSVSSLHQAELNLQTKVNALTDQRAILTQQMRTGSPALRMSAEVQALQLDLDLASQKAELAGVQREIAAQKAEGVTPPAQIAVPPNPPRGFLDRIDPDALTAVFILTSLAVLIPLSIGLARRLWRRPPAPSTTGLDDRLIQRLDRLDNAVDAIAIEVERISESQRFVAKVFAERPAAAPPPSDPVSVDVSPLGEGKPFLALGAGPLEPIRAAERQSVKQSVTPH